ncbi:MAG: nucleotidyltransferase domain-containing protein [Coriobacteriia bacterium]|nr:nucleotidyltransferase domain-containing protein [Coriobacteriia bacterium]
MNDTVYTPESIRALLAPIFRKNRVQQAVLFGSYSRGTALPHSDVDIYVDSGLRGLQFVGLIEAASNALGKNVDLIDSAHIESESSIAKEIHANGTVIYEG